MPAIASLEDLKAAQKDLQISLVKKVLTEVKSRNPQLELKLDLNDK